jgi:hypothetical protein
MASGENRAAAIASYIEAVAMFEEAKADFELLKKKIGETIRSGGRPTGAALAAQDELRKKVFAAADRLSRRQRQLVPDG